MINQEVWDCIERIRGSYLDGFITLQNELVLDERYNIYFRLEDVETETDFKCKMLEWISRPSCKGVNDKTQDKMLKGLNKFLGTDFSREEIRDVYIELGNGVNRELCMRFIESGYDMRVLREEAK